MQTVQDLLSLLVLEKVNENQFNGTSKAMGSPNVFGGQVLAQSLNAAYRTIKNERITFYAWIFSRGRKLEITD